MNDDAGEIRGVSPLRKAYGTWVMFEAIREYIHESLKRYSLSDEELLDRLRGEEAKAMNEPDPVDSDASGRPEVGPGQYRCGMCGEVFTCGWTDDEARDEAAVKGVDPATSGLACDDCYRLTPWGTDPERG
jgi:hypothetical protein